ncbi:uncharacterized protein LOC116240547 isoform X2 [Phasianus colchicus]|uniref:uncharacterized protein LOC116240547 isoform X2 n=1 Tax=Phasianus colchicus TaxID=9054 RepID=UPI00129E824D|nr:uncharacterized protein LOC116240547 isoform X2 [Phasianus colchicus]
MATHITKGTTPSSRQNKAGCHFACELTGERSLTTWLSLRVADMADFWRISFFLSLEEDDIFYPILRIMLIISLFVFIMTLGKWQGRRTRRYNCRDNAENHRAADLHSASQCSRTDCSLISERENTRERLWNLERRLKELNSYLEMSVMEVLEDTNEPLTSDKAVETRSSPEMSLSSRSDSSLTSIETAEEWHSFNKALGAHSPSKASLSSRSDKSLTPVEAVGAGCSSGASLSSWSDSSLAAIVATEPDCSLMAPLPPSRKSSCTSAKADESSCISQLTLSTPLHGADLGHAAMAQPDLMLSDALEPQEVQETLDCVVPEGKPEEETGLAIHGEGTLQEKSAPQMPQQPSEPHVEVEPRVCKPLFLDEAVKSQLERHMIKIQIQRCFGLPERVLASYKKFSETIQELQDCHPSPQRHTALPYHSPFHHWDRHVRTRRRAVRPREPQQESTARVKTSTRGTQTSVHSVPAAFVIVAEEVPREDLEGPQLKRIRRGTARSSSSARKKTQPGSCTKEPGPVTQGGDPGPSFSIQEEQTVPQSKGAPQEKGGQDNENATVPSGGSTGIQELSQGRTAPSGNKSPQIEEPLSKDTPITVSPPPNPAETSREETPSLEDTFRALINFYRVSTMIENQQNQLLASWLEQSQDNVENSRSEPAAESPVPTLCGAQDKMQKDKGLRQDGVRSRKFCPKCGKAARAPGSEGSWTSAPVATAAPGTGGDEAVGKKPLSGEGAKREQGQNQTADAAQQPEGARVFHYVVSITAVKHRTPLSQTQWLPKCESATDWSPTPEKPALPCCCYGCFTSVIFCLQRAWAKLLSAGKALFSKIRKK